MQIHWIVSFILDNLEIALLHFKHGDEFFAPDVSHLSGLTICWLQCPKSNEKSITGVNLVDESYPYWSMETTPI